MKILKQIGHQGDVQFYSIDKLPENAVKVNKQFIAASERTGHVHALSGNYDMYQYGENFVIDVKEDSFLNHTQISELNEETWAVPKVLPEQDHKPSTIKRGKYFVGVQRRFNPQEKFMEKVKD